MVRPLLMNVKMSANGVEDLCEGTQEMRVQCALHLAYLISKPGRGIIRNLSSYFAVAS
jgi:hypothetical protein